MTTNSTKDYIPKAIFLRGPPGSGKSTLAKRLVDKFDLCHLSLGDLLRRECQSVDSKYAPIITASLGSGTVVPTAITIKLLENAMLSRGQTARCFIIDGLFDKETLEAWHNNGLSEKVSLVFVLNVECPPHICLQRCLKRAKEQDRIDDNEACLKKRIAVYEREANSIEEYCGQPNFLHLIDGSQSPEQVLQSTEKIFHEAGFQ